MPIFSNNAQIVAKSFLHESCIISNSPKINHNIWATFVRKCVTKRIKEAKIGHTGYDSKSALGITWTETLQELHLHLHWKGKHLISFILIFSLLRIHLQLSSESPLVHHANALTQSRTMTIELLVLKYLKFRKLDRQNVQRILYL